MLVTNQNKSQGKHGKRIVVYGRTRCYVMWKMIEPGMAG